MHQTLEYKARLGNAATIIVADFNLNLDAVNALPMPMAQMLADGSLVDLDKSFSTAKNTRTSATSNKAATSQPESTGY